jgi:hypothetical protein
MTELNDILSNLSLNDDNSSSNLDTNLESNLESNLDTINISIWEHILNTMKYKGIGEKIITSNDIKKAKDTWKGKKSQFEPRLLCKQDTYESIPPIFKKYNICIISIKNGEYLLTKTNIYHNLDYKNETPIIEIRKNTKSLILNIGQSESSNLDNLRYSGIFESVEYLNEPILYGSLLNGRHRCSFTMKLGDENVDVNGSQYETDGCYESENKILLIECKTSKIKNFNIRQLYYPYRTIYDYIKQKKEIITIFITTHNDIIYIWKFIFTNPLDFTSIKCVSYKRYKLQLF